MAKLLTLGCSLTYLKGWKEKLSELLNYENVNLSVVAGSNNLQINKFMEYILDNDIHKDDIIVWQITYTTRNGLRLSSNSPLSEMAISIQNKTFAPLSSHYDINHNVFDKLPRYDLLCRSPILNEKDIILEFDENDQLQKLLSVLILVRKWHDRLLVIFGSDKVIDDENKKIFTDYFTKHNVNYIDQSFTKWVFNARLNFLDMAHPDDEAGQEYAKRVLHKKLIELNWVAG